MPLLFATGAGAQSRIALGAAVVFGMALNTLLATIYIPNFYELMQKFQENVLDRKEKEIVLYFKFSIVKNVFFISQPIVTGQSFGCQ